MTRNDEVQLKAEARAKRIAEMLEKKRHGVELRPEPVKVLPPLPDNEINVMPIEKAKAKSCYSNIIIEQGLCSVVILTYERVEMLARAIKSLRENTSMPLELIILEGGSSKETQESVYKIAQQADQWKYKQIIMSLYNCHSNAMINKGYAAARGEHVFLANDDIEIKSQYWAERLIAHGNNLPDAGIIGVSSNASYIRQIVPKNWNVEEHVGEYEISDQIAGCLVYVPRKTWHKVGEYDENLSPRCGGDADYSIRCRAHGMNLYFAKDVFVEHREYTTQDKWNSSYEYNQKKYGVNHVSYENGKHCVERAKQLYGIAQQEKKPEVKSKTDAVGIWFYRGTIIEHTIDSLVKYTPPNIPIYILEQSAPEMKAERLRLQKAVDKHGSRVQIHRCFVSRSRKDAPKSIIKFLEEHPEIEHLLKIDDDFIVCNDLYGSLKEAYNSKPNTLWAQAMCPINIVNLDILAKRVKECAWFPLECINPETMYNWLKRDNKLNMQIWESTTPPSRILPQLRRYERFVLEPKCKRDISASHYFAHRKDIIAVGGEWDEPLWHRLFLSSGRPRVMDTYSLAYHLAWFPATNYSLRNIVPQIIEKMEF